MAYDPGCLRKVANWSYIAKHHKFDKPTFDKEQFLKDIDKYSPKLRSLLNNIKALDEEDLKTHNKQFKHFIFSEVKQGGYGVKIITSALIASGFQLAYDEKLKMREDAELLKSKANNFLLLCSTDVYSAALSVKKKKEILDKYNQRPDNINGDLARIILLDAGFMEGIDLFDVKYVHIYEPQTSKANLKQAIGRATRLCGQKGLEFHPSYGWQLKVFVYDTDYKNESLFKLYIENTGIDLKKIEFVSELEKYSIIGSVDYELTKNVHNFQLESEFNTYVPVYKMFQPQSAGAAVSCGRKCGKLRPTKAVPVSIPLFATVMAAQGKVFPAKDPAKRTREYFCDMLKGDKEFCKGTKEAWANPVKYVQKNQQAIQEAIKNKNHENMPTYNRSTFMRFIKKTLKAPMITETTVTSTPLNTTQVKPPTLVNTQQSKTSTPLNTTQVKPPTPVNTPQTKTSTPLNTSQTKTSTPLNTSQTKTSTPLNTTQVKSSTPVNTPQTKTSTPLNTTQTSTSTHVNTTQVKTTPPALANPVPTQVMSFTQMRQFIRDNYIEYVWPKVKLENLCVPKGGTQIVNLTPTQGFISNFFTPKSAYKGMLLWQSVGTGKCFAFNTPILMYDGSVKLVQDIEEGDQVMGDDSTPRMVLSLGRGQDDMYKIKQEYGDDYTVNSEHILCLKDEEGEIHEIEVRDFIKLPQEEKDKFKAYKVPVEFPKPAKKLYDAYDIGTEYCNSKIPRDYLINTRKVRLQLLAGIIDSLGRLLTNDQYQLQSQDPDILFLARSLGLAASVVNKYIFITGQGIDQIPVRNPDNKAEPCTTDVLTHEFQIEHVGYKKYYGFTLDANNRFLLPDCTVTHNTCCAIATATSSFEKENYTILWVTRTTLKSDIWKNMFDQVCSAVIKDKLEEGKQISADHSQRLRMLSKSWKIKPMSYKQFSNLVSGKNQLYKDLVAINGAEDPLKRTLIIIDEAHKLYGGNDLSSIERPNMGKLKEAIMNSYKKSKEDSVKLLLMTATPITSDPMEFIKLLNLLRETPIPEEFEQFSAAYLDANGKFAKDKTRKYLDDIAGYISYLSREKDARQFVQPTIVPIISPVSQSSEPPLEDLQREHDAAIYQNLQEIAEHKRQISVIKQERRQKKQEINAKCDGLPKQEKAECLKLAFNEVGVLDNQYEQAFADHSNKISNKQAANKAIKQNLTHKRNLLQQDISQQSVINTKCAKKSTS